MRIALIHSHLEGRGGSQRYAIEITESLRKLGHDVDLFTYYYNPADCYPELLQGTTPISVRTVQGKDRVAYDSLPKALLSVAHLFGADYLGAHFAYLKQARTLADLVAGRHCNEGQEYDLVWANEGLLSAWAGAHLQKTFGIPLFWFCYDTPDKPYIDWSTGNTVAQRIRRFFLKVYWTYDIRLMKRHVGRAAVLDKDMAKKFHRFYGFEPTILPGAVNTAYLSTETSMQLRDTYAFDPQLPLVCCLTRCRRYRRVDDLLELYVRSIDEHPFSLYINAPGEDPDYLKEIMQRYGRYMRPDGDIVLDRDYPSDDAHLHAIYRSADLFIFPNEKQTWGNAALEAMANHTPTLISSGCGISHLFRDVADCVYPVGDVSALHDRVKRLLGAPDQLSGLAESQYQFVRDELTWDAVSLKYEKQLKNFVSEVRT